MSIRQHNKISNRALLQPRTPAMFQPPKAFFCIQCCAVMTSQFLMTGHSHELVMADGIRLSVSRGLSVLFDQGR